MTYAGVWIRFVALVVDIIVLFIAGLFIGVVIAMSGGESPAGLGVLFWLIGGLYWVVLESTHGGTIGKQLTGLRVVDEYGHRITLGQSFIRNVLRFVDGLFVYLVGAVFIWSSPMRQRLGDRAASTFVVRGDSVRHAARPPASPNSLPTLPATTRATHASQSPVWDEFRN